MIVLIAGVIGVGVVSLWKAWEAWEEGRESLMWGWLIAGVVMCGVLGAGIWLAMNAQVVGP
ncbi:MAG: hypothetical protein KF768_03200 [Phycisphaeraceae bacterium]|nr:hypothetical protein [Phycisphaeraceae bacterium]